MQSTTEMQQDLAFLDQPNSVVTITFNDFNVWRRA